MQILSTQIAAQQAAQSAPRQAAAAPAAFSAVLKKSGGQPGFEPLVLKQTAPQASAQMRPPAARPGTQIDIKV